MHNKLKQLKQMLLDNTLLKVQNQALGNKNPKWKEWWQTMQEFTKYQIQENMVLVWANEHVYQLEQQAYWITFGQILNMIHLLLYVEITTNMKTIGATSSTFGFNKKTYYNHPTH